MSGKRVILCSLVFAWVSASKVQNSFFVARQYSHYYNYFCVTNTSFALSWTEENVKESFKKKSAYVPEMKSTFHCDIEHDLLCTNDFTKRPWSLQSGTDRIILDERWEEMEVFKTEFVDGKNIPLNLVPVLKLHTHNVNNFDIPLSIRLKKEGHIFLCDGENPSESNCYWFMLQAFKGSGSAIRKCTEEKVPSEDRVYVKNSCKELRVSTKHPKFPIYLTSSKWSHFILSKQDGLLTFSLYADHRLVKILEWHDTEAPIVVTDMIVHSKMVNGLWKIHNLDFIATEERSNDVVLGGPIYAPEGFVCVSMYVSMCRTCKIKLSLTNQHEIINNMTYEAKHTGWNQIKFITTNVSNPFAMQLSVSTISETPLPYWQVDRIRFCRQEEFRLIGLTEKATCQLMSGTGDIITFGEQLAISENTCPENTIGPFCVTCNLIFDDCDSITICSKDQCVCSAGHYGEDCYYECRKRSYGHGCRRLCGKCYWACNNIDGTCSSCTDNYSGPKCDIPPSTFFANPPKVNDITYDGATISVSDFKIEKPIRGLAPQFYVVQYKEAKNSNSIWITDYNNIFIFQEPTQLKLNNLKSQTQYLVRGVILTVSGQWQTGEHLQYATFTTLCQEITDANIHIEAYDTSVMISLVQTTDITCKEYTMSLFEIQLECHTNSSGTYFVGLNPFSEYTLKVQGPSGTHEKKFMTTEGVPNKINGFAVTALTSSSVGLNWTAAKLNGNFKHYTVEYQHISYEACGSKSPLPSTKSSQTTTQTTITVSDLKPYSNYQISVSASNTKYNGEPYTQQITTSVADTIDLEEIPKIFNISTSQYSANIELTKVNCENIRGPVIIKYAVTCISEWCIREHREPKTDNITLPITWIPLYSLTPFSDYELSLKFCRENIPCDLAEKRNFQTKPAVPNVVKNLLIYTKNETSISLRWQSPAPPTGVLRDYKIIYGYHASGYQKRQLTVEPTSCEIWPQFYCQTLSDLENNRKHTIQVSARNEAPDHFGLPRQVSTTTKIEKSTAPYDLRSVWTLQNHLVLEWKHPNETNGDIQYFNIIVSEKTPWTPNSPKNEFNVTYDKYNLTYFYQINASEFKPTKPYEITVFAFNGEQGEDVSTNTTSPPDIPTLINNTAFKTSNETIQVAVSLNELRGRTDAYRLIVLRSKLDTENAESSQELKTLKNFKLVFNCTLSETLQDRHKTLILGRNQEIRDCDNIENPPLRPATEYNITVILINTHGSDTRSRTYSYSQRTIGELPGSDSSLLALLALLLLIPIVAFLYVKRNDFKSLKQNFFKQNTNSSTQVLEVQDDQIPLSQVSTADNNIQVAKKPKVQPRTSIGSKVQSKPIKITEFEEYVKESIKNGELERQHALFPRGQTKPWTYGSMKENKSKNRYNNLVAYDHSRVVLQKVDGKPHSDYINANYLDGYKVRRAYIATQGPKVATLDDFWRMVWQESVKYIANLANIYEGGKKKVEKYWPDINETLKFGDITVQYLSHSIFADYEHRIFTLTHTEECRKIEQLHFTSWPDHGVPLYSQSLVPFLQKILQIPLSSKAPLLVHCSAGVGRTGTILLCDICLRMAAREGAIDVLRQLQLLRDERPNMVDNIEQYKLVHLVVLECLVGLRTGIPCNELEGSVQKLIENGSLVLQMRYLKDTQWQDQAMKTVGQTGEEAVVVPEKNRFENIVPDIQGRVFISRSPPSDETSSYINAVKVDGFRCPGRFIVTQQPLPNTVGDFWRLVHEHSTAQYSVVISLNQIDPKDATCCSFWPTTAATELKPVPHITLKHLNTMSLECFDVTTVHLYTDSTEDFLLVQVIAMKNWAPKSNFPEKIEDFLRFWEQADSSARGTEAIFVTCYDGVRASGLYVAMSFIIEKMKMEQVCDVCQAVRSIRHNRPEFVPELEQFEFLYKAAVLYINGFESYANFN